MSSLYQNNYILNYNPDDIEGILNGRISYTPNPNNLKERRLYVVLQHCLIKNIEECGKADINEKLLKKYFNDFMENPYLFVDSPLIKDEFINRFVKRRDRKKILEYKNKYFDGSDITKLYENLMKYNTLSSKSKNKFYSFLTLQLRDNSNKYNIIIEECIKYILNHHKKVSELSETELKFFSTYIIKHAGANSVFPDIHILDYDAKTLGFENDNIVFLNKRTIDNSELYEAVKILCHEVRHAIQSRDSMEKNTRAGFEMATHSLFYKYLKTDNYDVYNLNYWYFDLERDADDYAYYYSKLLLYTLDRKDLSDKILKEEVTTHRRRYYYDLMIDRDKCVKSVDRFIVDYLDYIIKKHPEELQIYKVLRNIYNDDGTRKSLGNLIVHRINQNDEDKGLYDNYMTYEIAQNKLFKLDITNIKKDIRKNIFIMIGEIYKSKIELFNDYCNDNEYIRNNKEQIKITTLYQLKILDNILNFINQNMNYVLACENKINNKSFIYNFIYDLRNFNINNINNRVIKNDPIIRDRISKLLEKYKNIVTKYNEQILKDKTKDLSFEQKQSIIKNPNGVEMTFDDFLFYDLLPRLDGNTEVKIKGKSVNASQIINIYKSQLKNDQKEKLVKYK